MSVWVGRKAPDFTAPAVLGDGKIVEQFQLHEAIKGSYAMLFFYPLDFTFVCPSELIALDHAMQRFSGKGVQVIAVSVDSHYTHHAWRQTAIADGGIGPVSYPMVADIDHSICQAYGIEHPQARVAMRATFVIDRDGMVQSQVVNNLPLGRDIADLERVVDALQFFDQHGEVCPANWKPGRAGMEASPEGVAKYLAEHAGDL